MKTRKLADWISLLLTLACMAGPVGAATNYVSTSGSDVTGNGTVGNPWASIDHADSRGLLSPGHVVIVQAGTYSPASVNGVVLAVNPGTAASKITYQANGAVVINQTGANSYGFKVSIPGITLSGFEISGAQHGVSLAGSANSTVNACVIHDANGGGDAEGIFVNQSDNVTLTRNVIYNIHAAGEAPWGPVGVGIRMQGGNNLNVFNNTIDNAFLGVFCTGSGGNGAGPSGLLTTKNNIVVNITGWAFVNPWGVDPSKFSCDHNLVFNAVTAYGNYPAGNNGPFPSDVTAAPLFVGGGNYLLQAASPAIDKGINVGLLFAGATPDMGAYESADTTPPTLVTALRQQQSATQVTVMFSEPVGAATASNAVNYGINQNVTVSAVTVVNPTTVVLTTSALTVGPTYTLTVNVVQDTSGNQIANNSQINVVVPAGLSTYYVNGATGNDANIGSAALPWKTINNGDALGLMVPGNTVIVQAGAYTPASVNGVVLAVNAGTAASNITYQANGLVVVNQSGVNSHGFKVSVPGITLNGFEINGAQHGVSLAGSADSTVNACVIHDANGGGDAEGIFVNQSDNVTLTRNVIYNIHAAGEAPWGPVGCGIRASNPDNLKVWNNTIKNCYLGLFYYGAALGGGPYGHITTQNNIVVNCSGWAFVNPWSTDLSLFTSGNNLVYSNNINYGNYPAGSNAPLPSDVAANPNFVNAATNNYRLQSTSPAIDKGIDVGVPFAGVAPDMGAYESADTLAPTLVSARREVCQETLVVVLFSEPLNGATAIEASNYSINGGVTVSAAMLVSPNTVALSISPPIAVGPSLLTVNGIKDTLGNQIAFNSKIAIAVPFSSVIDLSGSIRVSNQVTQFTLTGKANQWYQVEASTNLANWLSLGRFSSTNGVVHFNDEAATNFAKRFYRARLVAPEPSFSFTYNGLSSTQLLSGWNFNQTEVVLDARRKQKTMVYSDPITGFEVRLKATEYADFPAVEWVVFFKNNGLLDTPILENVQAINSDFGTGPGTADFTLNYNRGCNQLVTDFKPETRILTNGSNVKLASAGGRSSSGLSSGGVMPYFNVEKPDGSGIIMAVGWSGQWAATFTRSNINSINVQAGMELTHLKLHPGEEIRTPSMLMLVSSGGGKINSHNQWRKLILDHYSPTPGGQRVKPSIAASPHGTISFTASAETNMIQGIKNCATNNLPIDTWWIDAGWYASWNMPGVAPWNTVGTWEPDPARYPNGLKPVADAAHAHGFKFLLWFEVERAVAGSWVANNHPEWLLQHSPLPSDLAYQEQFQLVNFGNSNALVWAKAKFSSMVHDVGIDVYRIDLNLDPLYYWRHNESGDRQGINEIKHIMGWYDYLDTLVSENPQLMIDNCAGGGRRLDIEMVKRSVSLTPSDYLWDPVGQQAMNYALSSWFPWHGIGAIAPDKFSGRSGMLASFLYAIDLYNAPAVWAPASAMLNEYNSIRQYYSGDFYPLTPYTVDQGDWLAWQFDRPDLGGGLVQAFRRSASAVGSTSLRLFGVDPSANYAITNLDVSEVSYRSGCDLMDQGISVNIGAQPGAAIFTYHKMP